MSQEDEKTVRVVADVPESVKETAKEKLEYGGISREIQQTLERIAFGEDLTQRSRLERQRTELVEERRKKREERREIDTDIENLDQRIDGIDEKLNNLTTREDKYEARLESLEHRLRHEGQRLDANHGAVKDTAREAGVEPEKVMETLKERNPDVPVYAFQDGLHDRNSWDGLTESQANREVAEREALD